MRNSLFITLAFITQAAFAVEYTVVPIQFKNETTLNAVFLPAKSTAISIKPEA